MDAATFARELGKYKVVRLADHIKIRWKTQRKPDTKPKLLDSLSNGTKPSAVIINGDEGKDFWKMCERVNAGTLGGEDMKRFMAAMREEHPSMVGAVNLDDLEHLASLLK